MTVEKINNKYGVSLDHSDNMCYYAMYSGKAKFGFLMYWQIEPNRNRVSLVESDKVEHWDSASILNTLREWKRFGVTLEEAVFIPASGTYKVIASKVE